MELFKHLGVTFEEFDKSKISKIQNDKNITLDWTSYSS